MNLQELEKKLNDDGFESMQIEKIKDIIYFIGIAEDLAWRESEGVLQEDIIIKKELIDYLKDNNIIIDTYSKYKKYPIYKLDKQATNIFSNLTTQFQSEDMKSFLEDFKEINQNFLCLIDSFDIKNKAIEEYEISKFNFDNQIDYSVLFKNSLSGNKTLIEFNKALYEFKILLQKYNYYFEITPFQSNLRAYEKFKFICDKKIIQILVKNEHEFKIKFGQQIKNLNKQLEFLNSMQICEDTKELRKKFIKIITSKRFNEMISSLSEEGIVTPIKFDSDNPYFNILDTKKYRDAIAELIQIEINMTSNPIIDYLLNPPLKSDLFGKLNELMKVLIEKPFKKEIKKESGAIVFISYATKDADIFKIPKIAEILTKFDNIEDVLYWKKDARGDIIDFMEESLENCTAVLLFCSPNAISSESVKKEYKAAQALKKTIIPIFFDEEHIPTLLSSVVGVKFDTFNFKKNIDEICRLISNIKIDISEKSKDEKEKEANMLFGMIKLKKKINIINASKKLGIEKENFEDFIFELVGKEKVTGELQDDEFIITSDINDFIDFFKGFLHQL
jgi:hypothetical protein